MPLWEKMVLVKSTFAKIVAGHSAYRVTSGNILFNGNLFLKTEPEERAQTRNFS